MAIRLERRGKMIKKHWKTLVITSAITLLPIIVGAILWNQLPDLMPSHWNAAGEIDGWSSKPFVVFALPFILMAAQWVCALATCVDPKKANHSAKIIHLVLWIFPILSVVLFTITYATALGKDVRVELVMPVVFGLLFTIIGNYLPKCKQNYTIGIKIPWTLNSEENWNRTHRFAGRLWTISGIAIILIGIFSGFWILMAVLFLMILAPVVYSYLLHRKGI